MNDNQKFWQWFAFIYRSFIEKGNGRMYDNVYAENSSRLYQDMNVLELALSS